MITLCNHLGFHSVSWKKFKQEQFKHKSPEVSSSGLIWQIHSHKGPRLLFIFFSTILSASLLPEVSSWSQDAPSAPVIMSTFQAERKWNDQRAYLSTDIAPFERDFLVSIDLTSAYISLNIPRSQGD